MQGLLGQREGRTGAAVIAWLSERTPQFREGVEYVAIDPAAAYASAIRTPGLLPNATLVVDHFHLVKLANDALTKVRRRVTWDLRDRRGRRIDPEWANRRRLLRARERLSDKSFAKMWNRIQAEDPSAQILSAWIAKEELRTLLSTVRLGGDPHLTRHRLHRFLSWCIDSQIPELLTLATTIDTVVARNQRVRRGPPSPTPAPRATTGCSNRSSASVADSGTASTRPAGYDSTAPANSGPQPRLHADCPVKVEEPLSLHRAPVCSLVAVHLRDSAVVVALIEMDSEQ